MPVVVAADGRIVHVELPAELWRIAYLEGFGWPTCERQEMKYRNFASLRSLTHLLGEIDRLPEHHKLLGLWRADTAWTPVEPDTIKQEHRHDADRDPTD